MKMSILFNKNFIMLVRFVSINLIMDMKHEISEKLNLVFSICPITKIDNVERKK